MLAVNTRLSLLKGTDSHLFGEELEDSLKKAKGRHSLQSLKPKTNYPHAHASSTERKFQVETSKNDRQTKRPMAGHKGTPQYNSPSTRAELNKQSRKSQYKNQKHGRN